jgi:hypothetical protein
MYLQVELYTHYRCVHKIIQRLQRREAGGLDCRLCSVHLVDSYYCRSVLRLFMHRIALMVLRALQCSGYLYFGAAVGGLHHDATRPSSRECALEGCVPPTCLHVVVFAICQC